MTRWLALLAAAVVLACAADAGAQSRPPKAQKESAKEVPLHIYRAKGEANACGDGCSEWIAVEGWFDPEAAPRVQDFLYRHRARKLPVYFHSPGGNTAAAFAIGRQMRQLGITAGVAATVPRGCASPFDRSDSCNAAKRAPQPVTAEWRPDVTCNSACVWALLGAKARHVPPAARLGVHAGKVTLMRKSADGRVQQVPQQQYASLHKTRTAEAIAATRRYIREMGIDTGVLDMAQNVPHEDVRYLTRDEIAAFGIDRREFSETPWFFAQFPSGNMYVSKWIAEARGPERKDRRVSVVLLRCGGAARASIQYVRGLASDEIGRAAVATFAIGKQKARLTLSGNGTKRDTIDNGGLFASSAALVSFGDFEAAAATDAAIRVTETDPRLDTKLFSVIELSTHGLAAGMKLLREKCGASTQAAPWPEGTSVPYVDPRIRINPFSPAGVSVPPADGKQPERGKR